MSPGGVLGVMSGAVSSIAVGLSVHYQFSVEAGQSVPLIALWIGLGLGVLAILVSLVWERRLRGLQMPPSYVEEVGDVVWPLPPLWGPWTAMGFATFACGFMLIQERLAMVGGLWTLIGVVGGTVTWAVRRQRRDRPWKVPSEPALFTWATLRAARSLQALSESGRLSAACSLPRGRLPVRLVAVESMGQEHTWTVDSVADGQLACELAGVHPTPPYAWRSGDSDLPGMSEAPAPPPPAAPPDDRVGAVA